MNILDFNWMHTHKHTNTACPTPVAQSAKADAVACFRLQPPPSLLKALSLCFLSFRIWNFKLREREKGERGDFPKVFWKLLISTFPSALIGCSSTMYVSMCVKASHWRREIGESLACQFGHFWNWINFILWNRLRRGRMELWRDNCFFKRRFEEV